MTSWTLTRRTSAVEEGFVTSKVRALIAVHLGIDVESVTADTHFTDDLGFDQLDVLELTIMIEDQFVDVEIPDEADQIEFVGDLIRQIEMVMDVGTRSKTGGLRPMSLAFNDRRGVGENDDDVSFGYPYDLFAPDTPNS